MNPEKMIIAASFIGIAVLLSVWVVRKTLGYRQAEKWLRIVVTLQLLPGFFMLKYSGMGSWGTVFFVTSWVACIVWIWRAPILCPHCLNVVIRRGLLFARRCPKCGESVRGE
jgi:hypothetical protein